MSNFRTKAIHPITGKEEMADYLDDYFGNHKYGVKFVGEDKVYREEEIKLKLVDNCR